MKIINLAHDTNNSSRSLSKTLKDAQCLATLKVFQHSGRFAKSNLQGFIKLMRNMSNLNNLNGNKVYG